MTVTNPTSAPDAPAPDLRGLIDYHKASCARYTNGQCSTRRCMIRGGWKPGSNPRGFDEATCEEHETVLALENAALRAERDEAQPVAWDSDFRAEIERIADDYHPCGGERDIAIALDEMREALQAALETHPPATSPGAAPIERGILNRCADCGCHLPHGGDQCGNCRLLEEDQMYADREMG